MAVSLRPVSRANVRRLCELRLADDQEQLVAPAAFTIAEGHYEPNAVLRAIYDDAEDEPIGVLLVETEGELPHLVRFMIDASRQRQGIGRQAVDRLTEELRQERLASVGGQLRAGRRRHGGVLAQLPGSRHGPPQLRGRADLRAGAVAPST